MTTLFGLSFSNNTLLKKALTSISGIGYTYADFLIRSLHLGPASTISNLSREQVKFITRIVLQQRPIGPSLERETRNNILSKVNVHCYQGIRHIEGLPVRGQNTKTNASTARKSRKKLK